MRLLGSNNFAVPNIRFVVFEFVATACHKYPVRGLMLPTDMIRVGDFPAESGSFHINTKRIYQVFATKLVNIFLP
jgi:hypothetical protein